MHDVIHMYIMEANMKSIIKHFSRKQKEIDIILEASKGDMGKEYFDIDFYNTQYDYSFSLEDGVKDYVRNGWKNGKNPSPYFCTNFYLQKYPDISVSKVNPLVHYIEYGKSEKRKICDCSYLMKNHATNLFILKQHLEFLEGADHLKCISYNKEKNNTQRGIFFFGDSDESYARLKEYDREFCDEMVFLVTRVSSSLLKKGVYSMNSIIEQVGDIGNLTFKRNESLVKCSIADYENSNIDDDYDFTNFVLRHCVMSDVVVLNNEDETILECFEKPASIEKAVDRFVYVASHYNLTANAIMQYYNQLEEVCPEQIRKRELKKIINKKWEKYPRIVISLYAFSNGGGEVVPLRVANELKEEGIPVAVHSLNCDKSINDIRGYLDPDIPVFYADSAELLNGYVDQLGVSCINTHHCSNQVLACEIINDNVLHVATAHGVFNDMSDEELEYLFDKVFKDKIDYWTYVSDKNLIPFQKMGYYQKDRFFKIVNGIKSQEISPVDLEKMGIPKSASVICLASRARVDKGWYKAIEAVRQVRNDTRKDIRLLLVGNGEVYDEIKDNHDSFVYPVGFQENVLEWFKASDICILPTYYKGESFPLTLVEALLCEKPIIATDIGDVKEILTLNTENVGELLHLTDDGDISIQELAEKIKLLCNNEDLQIKYSKRASEKKNEYRIENIVKQYLSVYTKGEPYIVNALDNAIQRIRLCYLSKYDKAHAPLVSVIVPNYNYERFLRRRLDSIYNQSYQNIEVILLDDVSTDSSRDIMMEYYQKYRNITKVCFNDQNCGVFAQWKKGIKMAEGKICWIAEADDWCDSDFLEILVPKFFDPDVRIAYGKYVFAEDDFYYDVNKYDEYLASFEKNPCRVAYVHDSSYEVKNYLSKKNTLVNVSGLLFRRFHEVDSICNDDWKKKRICGDWELYLKMLYGGKIAFDPDAHPYFRIMNKKQKSAGSSVYDQEVYYQEHEYIAELVNGMYQVDKKVIMEFYKNLEFHCNSLDISSKQKKQLMKAFDLEKALHSKVDFHENITYEVFDSFFGIT